ncbi:metal-dependent hydrolase family protein [Flavobacterium restrictum]|uniref:Amidohydrolase family protein n=1 Tax=Flavobacterium restrictum TaxID=2594428 RepID=A0A553E1T2_9FLAO|nr:amidohydrolase family protein [Flavobacterium restrictum]TRX39008.1 amidohydrolase family protein [Flavobacterium restrictum]
MKKQLLLFATFLVFLNVKAQTAILIENVSIFNGKENKITIGDVLINDNKIVKIATTPIKSNVLGLKTINGKGKFLIPGLIDNHVHLSINTMGQMELLDPKLTEAKMDSLTRIEGKNMLLRGFTAVRDLGGPVFNVKKDIDAGKVIGPRIYPSGAMISQTSGHGDSRLPNEKSKHYGGQVSRGELMGVNYIADGVPEVLNATRENLRAGATQIKVMAGGGAATAYDPLDVTQYSLEELKAAVGAAEDWGTYVTVHAYTARAVRRSIEAGVKVIEHGQLLDEETIQLMADKGIYLSLQVLDPAPEKAPETTKIKKQKVVDGTDFAFQMAKKYQVKLAWGTDYLFDPKQSANQNTDILKLKKWFSPFEILKLVTYDNAKVLALSGERNPYQAGALGVIEEGAYADMILVNGNPLQNIDLVGDPAKNFLVIIKNGVVVKNTL